MKLLAVLFSLAFVEKIYCHNFQSPEELLSYMQARGFMQIDEIVHEKPCVHHKFYITHDSTQKCLTHSCNDKTIMSEFDCKLWNKLKKSSNKLTKLSQELTRKVRNQVQNQHLHSHNNTKHEAAKNKGGEFKESVIEVYSVKPDTCTFYKKIQTAKGTLECWRKNCKDNFSIRVQCKLFDTVKPQNRHTVYKKRRHHGKI